MDTKTEKPSYPILIADYNSAGIRAEAARMGATHMRFVGSGYAGDRREADYMVSVYAIPCADGTEAMVADTNADPVWRDYDESEWCELMESIGLTPEAQAAAPNTADGYRKAEAAARAAHAATVHELAETKAELAGLRAEVGIATARLIFLGDTEAGCRDMYRAAREVKL